MLTLVPRAAVRGVDTRADAPRVAPWRPTPTACSARSSPATSRPTSCTRPGPPLAFRDVEPQAPDPRAGGPAPARAGRRLAGRRRARPSSSTSSARPRRSPSRRASATGYRLVFNTGAGRPPDRLPRAPARARRPLDGLAAGMSPPRRVRRPPAGLALAAGCSPPRLQHHERRTRPRPPAGRRAPTAAPARTPHVATLDAHREAARRCGRGSGWSGWRCPTAYTPSAPYGTGTDDYRCFVLDPHLQQDAFITGLNILPGQPKVVHHVILFRVPPGVGAGRRGQGRAEKGRGLDLLRRHRPGARPVAPRRRALAGRLGAGRLRAGAGQGRRRPAAEGLAGDHAGALQPARRAAAGRLLGPAAAGARRPRSSPPLRDRCCCRRRSSCPAARATTSGRSATAPPPSPTCRSGSGTRSGRPPTTCTSCAGRCRPGPVQTCDRTVQRAGDDPGRRRAHAPARPVDQDRGRPRHARARGPSSTSRSGTSTTRAPRPSSRSRCAAGDTVRVTCRHDQCAARPAAGVQGPAERYVVWGEGTTDEMCLGILLVTAPLKCPTR